VRDENASRLNGDSFVEANMLPSTDRPGATARAIPRWPTAPSTQWGSTRATGLARLCERNSLASERFGIRDFVVPDGKVGCAPIVCGSGNIHGPLPRIR
jgi:hypothetical protein